MTRIDHIAMWAKNLETLRAFYEKYFGGKANQKYTNASKNFASYFLSFASGARLEIMQMPSVPDSTDSPYDQFTGYIHLAFCVGSPEEVDSLTATLAEDGFEVLDGPRHTGDGCYESVVLDPEKNRIEITS